MAPVAEQSSTKKQHLAPLKVFIDLCLKKRTLDNFLTYILRWLEQSKSSIHLCSKKLKTVSMPVDGTVKVLSMVQLDCVQVSGNWPWHLPMLATFAPFLGKMNNMQRLCLSPIHLTAFMKQEQDHFVQITSQFLRLGHLLDLHLFRHVLNVDVKRNSDPQGRGLLWKCRLWEGLDWHGHVLLESDMTPGYVLETHMLQLSLGR